MKNNSLNFWGLLIGIIYYYCSFSLPTAGKDTPIFYIEIFSLIIIFFLLVKKNIYIHPSTFFFWISLIMSVFPMLYNSDLRIIEGPKMFIFKILIYTSIGGLFKYNSEELLELYEKFMKIFLFFTFFGLLLVYVHNGLYLYTTIYDYKPFVELPYGLSNYIAQFVMWIFIYFLFKLIFQFKFEYLFTLMFATISLLITNSRSATATLILLIVIVVFINIQRIFKLISNHKLIILISVIPVGSFLILLFHLNIVNLFIERVINYQRNLNDRLQMYTEVINIMKKRNLIPLLFGSGMGSEKSLLVGQGSLIHNVELKLLYDSGFIGFFLYFIYFFRELFKSFSLSRVDKRFLAISFQLCAVLITSTIEPVLFTSFLEYFIILPILCIDTSYKNKMSI
jgi:O-antigen ligase